MIKFKAMTEFELGIFTNPHAPKPMIERAAGMLWRLPLGYSFCDIIPPSRRYQPFPNRVILVGGDGSIGSFLQMMYDREAVRPVGLLPGGSQNVLYNALFELGLKSDVGTFLKKGLDEYTEDQKLRPGMIGDLVFTNHAGLGRFEQNLGRFNAKLRFLPNGRRTLVSALLSLALAALNPNSGKEVLSLYTITPRIGQVPAFPDQRLLSDSITHARVRNLRALVQTMVYWQKGESAPNEVMTQYQYHQFADVARGDSVWVDGDTIPYPRQAGALIRRAPYGIPMVAIT